MREILRAGEEKKSVTDLMAQSVTSTFPSVKLGRRENELGSDTGRQAEDQDQDANERHRATTQAVTCEVG